MLQYRQRQSTCLHWATWNDEYVIFDETSGQTSQLDAMRAYVLNLVIESPKSSSVVILELLKLDTIPGDQDLSQSVETILTEFMTNGLLEVVE